MTIVITAGNHDSASRHEITKALWSTQNVYMVGSVDKDDLRSQIVELPGRKGFIIAVPYINERSIPEGFWQSLLDEAAGKNPDGLPVVLMAHLTVSGSDFRGHDDARDYSVGGIDSIELDALGTGYDYVALGHIHHAQTLKGSGGRVRYSGTPIKYSFSEIGHKKTITLGRLGKKGELDISEIPFVPIHDLCEKKGLLEELIKEPCEDYLHIILEDEIHTPNVFSTLRKYFPNIMAVDYAEEKGDDISIMDIGAYESSTPEEIFAKFFVEVKGRPMSDEQSRIISELIEKIWREKV